MQDYREHNRKAWDDRVRNGQRHTRTVSLKELAHPLKAVDPEGWLEGSVQGRRVLCLAAGGGLQSALYAAAGGEVTVVDLSQAMLDLDEEVAARHRLKVTTLQASMDDLSALPRAHFDLVIQPVSTCYVPEVSRVYEEVAKVTSPGGIYISQHKQPINLQTSERPSKEGYVLKEPYLGKGPLASAPDGLMHREAGTLEYLHTWSSLIGELCRAGFVLEDLSEPLLGDSAAESGSPAHRYAFAPPYVKLKARLFKAPEGPGTTLILPGA